MMSTERMMLATLTSVVALCLAAPGHAQSEPAAPADTPAGAESTPETSPDAPLEPPANDSEPPSQAVEDARIRYQRGTELYKAGDFKLALIEFQRAYETAPNYRVLYNIGQVNMQLNRYAMALRAFERYLAEGGDEVSAERRESIEMELGLLHGRTATIVVTANEEGAEVRIDGVPVGTTPLGALLIDAGEHNVTVSKEGRSKTEYVVLAGKEQKQLAIVLPQPEPKTIAPVNPIIIHEQGGQGLSTAPIITWIATGVLTAGAIGTGVAALSAQTDLEELKNEPTTASRLDEASSKATALSITTDALIVSAVLLGGASLYLTLTDDGLFPPDDEDATSTRLGIGIGALSVSGSF